MSVIGTTFGPANGVSQSEPMVVGAGELSALKSVLDGVQAHFALTGIAPVRKSLAQGPRIELDPPKAGMVTAEWLTGEAAQFYLGYLYRQLGDAQMGTVTSGIRQLGDDRKATNEAILKKLKERVEDLHKRANMSWIEKLFSILAKVFMYIAAIFAIAASAAASAASGGAATVLLALAVMALVQMVASDISAACGGPNITLGKGLTSMFEAILRSCGVPEDQLRKLAPVLGLALCAVTCGAGLMLSPDILGNGIAGIAELSGADKQTSAIIGGVFTLVASIAALCISGKLSTSGVQALPRGDVSFFTAANTVADVAKATGSVSSATMHGVHIHIATLGIESADRQALVKELQAKVQQLVQYLEDNKQVVIEMAQREKNFWKWLVDNLSIQGDQRRAVIREIQQGQSA